MRTRRRTVSRPVVLALIIAVLLQVPMPSSAGGPVPSTCSGEGQYPSTCSWNGCVGWGELCFETSSGYRCHRYCTTGACLPVAP